MRTAHVRSDCHNKMDILKYYYAYIIKVLHLVIEAFLTKKK